MDLCTRLVVTTSVSDESSLPVASFGMCAGIRLKTPPRFPASIRNGSPFPVRVPASIRDGTGFPIRSLVPFAMEAAYPTGFVFPFGMETDSRTTSRLPSTMEPDFRTEYRLPFPMDLTFRAIRPIHSRWKPGFASAPRLPAPRHTPDTLRGGDHHFPTCLPRGCGTL